MNNTPQMSLSEQLAAAQAWWRDAGVDYEFVDEPTPWLKAVEDVADLPAGPAAKALVEAPPEPAPPAIEISDLPDTLEAFQAWWTNPDSAIPGAAGQRLAPRGVAGAKLMVIVPAPEQGDRDALLQGAQGKLIANILRALGVPDDSAYVASALPSVIAEPDWIDLNRHGLGAILAHHVALAKPERVLLFGRGLPILLGHDPDASPESLTHIDSPAGKLPVLTTFAPDRLLGHARQRARLWHRLLDWME